MILTPKLRCRIAPIALFAAILAAPAVHAECRMAKLGTMPLISSERFLLVAGRLNGHDITILVDTGASESLIWKRAAERAGLHLTENRRVRMVGFSGDTAVYNARVDELQIADFTIRDRVWPVIDGEGIDENLGMILGADFWSRLDFEINIETGEIVLWEAQDCENTALAYWDPEFMLAKLARGADDSILTDVLINGTTLRAEIDTGATVTVVNSRQADRLGSRAPPEDEKYGEARGIGGRGILKSEVAVFDKVEIGDLQVKNASIATFDMDRHTRETGRRTNRSILDVEDMLLGADFLRANRVLIANSQGYMYMTYVGGRVFESSGVSRQEFEFRTAHRAMEAGDYETALETLELLALEGYPPAQTNLGYMYSKGFGVKRDETEAANWYRKAAEHGNATAQYNLGSLYYQGRGVEQRDEQAAYWYRQAAEQGDPNAQHDLGWLYANGRGVDRDDKKAMDWYHKAIDQNNTSAINSLAWLLATSPDEDVRDGEKAVSLAERYVEEHADNVAGLDTLAAAYAEVGRFDDALAMQRKVLSLADENHRQYDAFEAHLESYRNNKPWREK